MVKHKCKLGEGISLGAQSIDTLTDKNYRGKGMFTGLARDLYLKEKNEGVKFVYGFPNGNSIHGFSKKLDWFVLDPVPFLIKPLGTSYFTKRKKYFSWLPNINLFNRVEISVKNYQLREESQIPDQINELWGHFSKNIRVSVERDFDYLSWRYLKKPGVNYKLVSCYEKEKLIGFIVYVIKEKHNGRIGYIMELMHKNDKSDAGSMLVSHAEKQMRKDKADLILAWSFDLSPNFKSFKRCKFLKFKEKYRPIELHFGVACFDDKFKHLLSERENWYLSYSDSDTV